MVAVSLKKKNKKRQKKKKKNKKTKKERKKEKILSKDQENSVHTVAGGRSSQQSQKSGLGGGRSPGGGVKGAPGGGLSPPTTCPLEGLDQVRRPCFQVSQERCAGTHPRNLVERKRHLDRGILEERRAHQHVAAWRRQQRSARKRLPGDLARPVPVRFPPPAPPASPGSRIAL